MYDNEGVQEELQEVVDEIARVLGAPATLEDRAFRLLAHAAHSGELDEVRQQSILRRRATDEVRAYFEGYGIATAPGPVRIPADAELRVLARRSEEHTSELQSRENLVCRLLLEKKNE